MSELTFRPLGPDDAADLFDVIDRNRPELAKFWWEERTQSPEDSAAFIEAVNSAEKYNGAPTRAIIIDGKLGGVAALHTIDWEHRTTQLGYWIDKEQAGKGYTTEAARMLLHLAFDDLGLEEARITPRETNVASRRVAEKIGCTLLGIDHEPTWKTEEKVDVAVYAMRREEFAAQQPAA